MKKIKAVLFDFDGTICDTNKVILESWQAVFQARKGYRAEEGELFATFGEPLAVTMKRWFPEDTEECIEIYREHQKAIYFDMISIYPGMEELIRGLKQTGYKTALVTSRLKASTWDTLVKYEMTDCFDVFVSCDDTDKHKPDPEPVLIALERLGVSPEEAVMIGDTKFDILCARNAGVRSILVDWSAAMAGAPDEEESAPDFRIKRAEEVLEILSR